MVVKGAGHDVQDQGDPATLAAVRRLRRIAGVNATAFDDLIRTRRTHKAFGPTPSRTRSCSSSSSCARWAPNRRRDRPVALPRPGPAGPGAAQAGGRGRQGGRGPKLDRAPTLIAASAKQTGDAAQDQEDVLATAVASYIVLLGAHARGLAGYWRTVPVIETAGGRAALGLPDDEVPIGLLHVGDPRQEQRVPDARPSRSSRSSLNQWDNEVPNDEIPNAYAYGRSRCCP